MTEQMNRLCFLCFLTGFSRKNWSATLAMFLFPHLTGLLGNVLLFYHSVCRSFSLRLTQVTFQATRFSGRKLLSAFFLTCYLTETLSPEKQYVTQDSLFVNVTWKVTRYCSLGRDKSKHKGQHRKNLWFHMLPGRKLEDFGLSDMAKWLF